MKQQGIDKPVGDDIQEIESYLALYGYGGDGEGRGT